MVLQKDHQVTQTKRVFFRQPWTSFSLAKQELQACIGYLGKLDCLYSKKRFVQLKNGRVQTGFKGWVDTEPTTPVNNDLHAVARPVVGDDGSDYALQDNLLEAQRIVEKFDNIVDA